MEYEKMAMTLILNTCMALIGFLLVYRLIPRLSHMFIKGNLFGIDMNKSSKFTKNPVKVPEAQGVVCGAVFLIIMFMFIPVCFHEALTWRDSIKFPFHEYVQFLAALLSICCMIFLGFADDVLDLRWRHKLLLPTIASLPLLMVYYVTFDLTEIIVPAPLRNILGYSINIGIFYYLYMGMLAVFCTNAINIVAGINGLEAGQSIIIAATVIIFNLMEINGEFSDAHLFSLYFLIPYVGVSMAVLIHNWYPSSVFVGDTFCYFSGMTFAVVAILGHFSKTMLLFFIPQVFNFVFSTPQLFHLIPCPRHRLPRYDSETDLLSMSYTKFKKQDIGILGRIILRIFHTLRLIDLKENIGENEDYIECSNMTIITLLLKALGPTHECSLTIYLLVIQIACSFVALLIRYPLARLFYEESN